MLKKLGLAIVMMGLTLGVITGCASSAAKTIDVKATAEKLASDVTWKDQISVIDPASKALTLYGIEETAVANSCVYLSTNATAEEIAIFEAADADSVATIEEAVKKRIETQKTSFESYNPDEVPKLENPYMVTKGNYVICVVCDNIDEAKTVIDAAFQ